MRASDDALRNLISHYSQSDVPTLIVFFGDHQPPLGNDFYEAVTGKPLDDLFRVSVRSWKQRDEYGAPLLCRERMDRIGPEHLQMIPFNPKNPWDGRKNLRPIEIEPLAEPASEQHHRLTLTMTTTDGRTKSTSIDYPPKTGL